MDANDQHPVTDDDYVMSELSHVQRSVRVTLEEAETEEGGEADGR